MRIALLGVALLLAWPTVAQSPDEKPKSLSEEARESIACKDVPGLRKVAEHFRDSELTEQDKNLIRDRNRFTETLNRVIACSDRLSGEEKAESVGTAATLLAVRVRYLEGSIHGLAVKYNELAGNYNHLTANYNDLLDTAKRVVLAERADASPRFPWFKMPLPVATPSIQGPVVCSGDTIDIGQGMSNFHVNCHE